MYHISVINIAEDNIEKNIETSNNDKSYFLSIYYWSNAFDLQMAQCWFLPRVQ